MDYSNHTTDKYECRKCRKSKMYPNLSDNKIMGYVCAFCGSVNYPHKDEMIVKKIKINGIEIAY